jgi:hypothetical protein
MSNSRVAFLVLQVVAIAVAHAIYLCRRRTTLPQGSEVERINGHRVLAFSFMARLPFGKQRGNDGDQLLAERQSFESTAMKALKFVGFEVHGVNYEQGNAVICADADAVFFSAYGRLQSARGSAEYVCVGDFDSRDLAELIVSLIDLDGPRF